MKTKYLLQLGLAIVVSGLFGLDAFAAKPLFNSEEPLQAVLTAPVSEAYREKKKDIRLYMGATLSYKKEDNSVDKLNVKIRTRGNFRRLNCMHPPLRLNFVKKANDNTLFEKQNKLKLVGPCQKGPVFQQLLNLEYLAYQIWEEVSEFHFKTRLIEMSYVDSGGKRKPWSSTTFVIEDEGDLAKRLKLKVLDLEKVARQQLHRQQTALVELFELLIGNTDYSTLTGPPGSMCCHNAKLLGVKGATSEIIPVPYDFDVSGFVNAPYAAPATQYPIKNVRQRYFNGWCKEDRHFLSAIERFNERKARVYSAVQDSGLLAAPRLKKTIKYLDNFYQLINDETRVKREILGRCRGGMVSG